MATPASWGRLPESLLHPSISVPQPAVCLSLLKTRGANTEYKKRSRVRKKKVQT